MRRLTFILFLFASVMLASDQIYFTSDPAPSPDGKTVAFVYAGDIWLVPLEGGTATRLTAMDGIESNPVFSPDGKWIAFTGRQSGNQDVFIVPVNGGQTRQLTFNDGSDVVDSWSWDSQYIYFVSNRYNVMTSFKVLIDGGTPVRIFDGYMNRQHNIAENPVTGEIFFNETWESNRFASRKHYKGDYNPDIKSYNFKTGEYKVYTTYRGKDMWATIDKYGKIYFVSDEANGEYNLYTFENGNKKQLTDFTSSMKRPRVSASGNVIVFEKEYQICAYNTVSGKTDVIPVSLFSNSTLNLEKDFSTAGKITNFNVSPDGKKIVFVSRGLVFVSDIKGKFVRQLKTNSKERVMEVMWLGDNETVLYSQTVNGWLNLFTIKVNGEPVQITDDKQNDQGIIFNADRTKGLYFSGRNELRMIDLKTFKSDVIVKDEFWALESNAAYFSPDNKYVAYTAYRNFEQDIFVYDIEKKVSNHITKTGVTEAEPFWSPDGKYIYFTTDRYKATYPWGPDNADIYRVALMKYDKEFKSSKFDELFAKKDAKKDSTKPEVIIDFSDLNDRWESIVDKSGNQSSPYVIQKDDETTVLYVSSHDGERPAIWKTVLKAFEEPKTEKITGASARGYQICEAKGNYYVLAGSDIYELKLATNKLEKISVDFKFSKDLEDEFAQMFYEAWANLDENYYDGNFHGVDWEKMRDRYGKFLPFISTRENLRTVMDDMLGELNSSHLGFTSNGEEEKTFYNYRTIAPGIVFENDNPYKVSRVVKNSCADKDGVNIQPGDVLVALNGQKLDPKINREYYFTGAFAEDEITLTFERGGKSFDVKIHPESRAAFESDLYDEWIADNQKLVDDKTGKKVAYVYMKDMGGAELNKFLIDMTNEATYRDGLILDIRYNRGGNVHDNVLEFLSRRPYLQWKYRGGKLTIQPNFAPSAKPIVLLVNEQSLSDAEMTGAGFKQLGLGKIIGTETYRWIIFTSGKSLVDGSFYRLPSWGCYTLDGKDLESNGVGPDIYVKNTMKDRLEHKDPQLERAIEEVMKELK